MRTYIVYWYANRHDDRPIAATLYERSVDDEYPIIPVPNKHIPDGHIRERKRLTHMDLK